MRIIKLKEEFDFYVSQASSFFSFFSSIYPRAYMKRDNDNETNTELDIYINHKISIQKKHASKWRNINDFQVSDSRNVRTKRKMYRVTFLNWREIFNTIRIKFKEPLSFFFSSRWTRLPLKNTIATTAASAACFPACLTAASATAWI